MGGGNATSALMIVYAMNDCSSPEYAMLFNRDSTTYNSSSRNWVISGAASVTTIQP